tara:strand:- start:832 stop:1035 length:204 start_codon:yes stop_codon:yes gene_type:complete
MSDEPSRKWDVEDLVYECIATHNEAILIELISRFEEEYVDLARLGTMGSYDYSWTHEDVLNFMTYDT